MGSKTQYVHAEKYESRYRKESQNVAFLFPVMAEYLKSEIPGKRVLDIGCGSGIWCHKVALSGAKSVDGFDMQEEKVLLAQQATSQFGTVKIRVGDIMDMPYDDNVFDVALSFYIICALRLEALICHFKEMYRVLAPGGKAMMVCYSRPAFGRIFLRDGADKVVVEKQIAKKLLILPNSPTQEEINDAFEDLHDVLHAPFTTDQNGQLQRVTDVDKLSNGQAMWSKTQVITFPEYFYDDDFVQQQIKAAGLNIDNIESYYTEERRVAYNNTNPEIKLDKAITDTPLFVMYHLSKPVKS